MFSMSLNPTMLAAATGSMPDTAELTFERLCPYMTQKVAVKLVPDPQHLPIASYQLAKQLTDAKKNTPDLRIFQFDELRENMPTIIKNDFSDLRPGKVLLLNANLRRGLGDFLLLLPLMRALSNRFRIRGWSDQFGISTNSEFAPLLYGKEYIQEILPEFPNIDRVLHYDYVLEYGLHVDRMRDLAQINDWREIDLNISITPPLEFRKQWQPFFSYAKKKVFINWSSFDRRRSQSTNSFAEIKEQFPDAAFYASAFQNQQEGELFPGGPYNLWPKGKSIADLIAVLSFMDVVITTNTGVAHAAAALGIPTITLFSGRLYCWEGYWPDKYKEFYPSMVPIGLTEDYKIAELTEEEMTKKVIAKLHELLD